MDIYRGKLELLDYLFFATVERGKVYETGMFVHNYALTYALGLVQSESYTYSNLQQQPLYQDELTPLNGTVYLTPATPIKQVAHRLVQWNTLPEGYAFPGKPPSIGYPDWGFARVLRPQGEFRFYLILHEANILNPRLDNLLVGQPVRVRLGKFNGKAKITLTKADKVIEKTGEFRSNTLLNWRDIAADPLVCDVITASLPTRLINHSHFVEGGFYEAEFDNGPICLPQEMQYLARPLLTKKKRG